GAIAPFPPPACPRPADLGGATRKRSLSPLTLGAGLGRGPAGRSPGAGRAPAEAEARFFESRIRPLLANHCYSCHGPKKQRSDLRLDSPEAFRKGGSSGEALVSTKAEASLLLRAVRHADDVSPMPPKGQPKEQEIADLVRLV